MSLARVKSWVAGELLTANDLNGEFNNILNNPVSLISPTTGAINFAAQAHTGLVPSALTGTSGSTGQVPTINAAGTVVWANVISSGFAASGSTGQVLAVTSSNTGPSFQVIPPDGGLSTTVPSTGMLYYISTQGKLVGLTIGTTAFVLTVSTNGLPVWSSATGGSAAGSGGLSTGTFTVLDDFFYMLTSGQSGAAFTGISQGIPYTITSGTPAFTVLSSNPSGVARLNAVGTVTAHSPSPFRLFGDLTFTAIFGWPSTQPQKARIGLVGTTGTNAELLGSTNVTANDSVFFVVETTAGSSTGVISAIGRVGGVETRITTTAVVSSSGSTAICQLVFTSSATSGSVRTNGVTAGAFTSSEVPTSTMNLVIGIGSSVAAHQLPIDAWQVTGSRPVTTVV